MKQNQAKTLIINKLTSNKLISSLLSFLLTLILSTTLNAQSQGFSPLDQAIAKQEALEYLMSIDQIDLANLRAKLMAVAEDDEGAMAEDGTYITENGTYSLYLSEEEANIITLFQDVADVFRYEDAVLLELEIDNGDVIAVNEKDSFYTHRESEIAPVAAVGAEAKKRGLLTRVFLTIPRGLHSLWRMATPRPVRLVFTTFAGAVIGISGYKYLEENPDVDGAGPVRFAVNVSKRTIGFLLNIANALISSVQSYQEVETVEEVQENTLTPLPQYPQQEPSHTNTPPETDTLPETESSTPVVEQQPLQPSVAETEVQVDVPVPADPPGTISFPVEAPF